MEFKREKMSSLNGQTEVRYIEQPKKDDAPFPPFRITASLAGVKFEGTSTMVYDIGELQALAKAVSDAWKDHEALMPKLAVDGKNF